VKKRGTPKGKEGRKRKSKAVVESGSEGEEGGSGEEKKVKKGGFHKPMILSASLGEFLGETAVSFVCGEGLGMGTDGDIAFEAGMRETIVGVYQRT
jgi:hypothetical protein